MVLSVDFTSPLFSVLVTAHSVTVNILSSTCLSFSRSLKDTNFLKYLPDSSGEELFCCKLPSVQPVFPIALPELGVAVILLIACPSGSEKYSIILIIQKKNVTELCF